MSTGLVIKIHSCVSELDECAVRFHSQLGSYKADVDKWTDNELFKA